MFAQSKINFPLHRVINDPEKQFKPIHLTVQGDVVKIKSSIRNYGGTFKYSFLPSLKAEEVSFISLPAKNIAEFAKNDFVKRIEFYGAKPSMLNDTMKININVNAVHQGSAPLLQAYDGTGVLIGIIDAGIELEHPDFLDSLGRTRVLALWDQTLGSSFQFFDSSLIPQPYNYGQVWDSSDINAGNHHHVEQSDFYGHGSHVSGIAAGDGSSDSVPLFKGMAPNADLIVVASDFNSDDWLSTIADAVTFIFNIADSLNKPCVINISAGTYGGSHDGKDFVAQYINDLITTNPGKAKAVVCAAGNAGQGLFFHLRTDLVSNTKFTWFKENESLSIQGYAPDGGVYFEMYADTADFNDVTFSFSADKFTPFYELTGTSNSYNIKNLFNGIYTLDWNGIYSDSLKNSAGQKIADIYFGADLINNGTAYVLYVLLNPFAGQYYYRYTTSGTGNFDIWSQEFLGASNMVYDSLPSVSEFPGIVNYSGPDQNQTIVSSFSCAPNVITVGNYCNRFSYISYFDNEIFTGTQAGALSPSSSKGPTRDQRIKPDIAAPGSPVLSAGTLFNLAGLQNSNNDQLAQGGMHREFSGTSMSSPAVAGLSALYFQKFPDATVCDLFDALTQNAKADTVTGMVPNYSWGFGKADAFETLKSANVPVAISNPDSISCPGPVKLTLNSIFSFNQWSNGATGINNTVNQSGNYSAIVTHQKGCTEYTDTVAVFIDDSLPSPVISVSGDPFFCQGDSVQLSIPDTFELYLWNTGNISESMFANTTDFYSVSAIANSGCNYSSDSLLIWAKPKLPEPSIFQNGNILSSTPADTYLWYFNGIVFTNESNDSLQILQSGYYQVQVFHVNGCGTISDSLYVLLTGEDESGKIHPGFNIFPNPNEGTFSLEFTAPLLYNRLSKIELEISNVLGQRIYFDSDPGLISPVKIDLSNNPAGIYFLKIKGEGILFFEKIILQKN